jgi:hypothetical protein
MWPIATIDESGSLVCWGVGLTGDISILRSNFFYFFLSMDNERVCMRMMGIRIVFMRDADADPDPVEVVEPKLYLVDCCLIGRCC